MEIFYSDDGMNGYTTILSQATITSHPQEGRNENEYAQKNTTHLIHVVATLNHKGDIEKRLGII